MNRRLLRRDVSLYYPKQEEETANLVWATLDKATIAIQEAWGLPCSERCRIYILGSLITCIFHSMPWLLRPLYLIWSPLWIPRFLKMRKWMGGLTLRFSRPAVFLETPAEIAKKDRSIGKQIYSLNGDDPVIQTQHCVVHELTHAFSARLRLPVWLNEGLAMVTEERFFGFHVVRSETLETLKKRSGRPRNLHLHRADKDEIIYRYAQGYWLTRYLSETRPELLPSLLKKRRSARSLEKRIARELGMTRRGFWASINERVVEHYAQ